MGKERGELRRTKGRENGKFDEEWKRGFGTEDEKEARGKVKGERDDEKDEGGEGKWMA